MSLFTTYSDANKVWLQRDAVTVTRRLTRYFTKVEDESTGDVTWHIGRNWLTETNHNYSYEYVGMTEAAATSAATALNAGSELYGAIATVELSYDSDWVCSATATSVQGQKGVAVAQRDSGDMWKVSVSVNYSEFAIASNT